jgi:predicted nuclease of restriction endonuclease-like (RecB) superfamily
MTTGEHLIMNEKERKCEVILEDVRSDLQQTFPETYGFSVRKLERMRQLVREYQGEIATQAVSQLPWGHIMMLIQRIKDRVVRDWYITQPIENGWSRHTLENYIKQDLYNRQAVDTYKTTNQECLD